MAITDLQISEELMTNAPSIKYRGNEGPKSPQEMEQMMMADAILREEYDKYVFDLLEIRPDATPMSFEEFRQMVIAEGQMSSLESMPEGREMAAYGGIMGMDGRKKYGIGSYFQELKDKLFGTVKDNPELTAALVLGGADLSRGEDSALRNIFKDFEIPESVRNAGTAAKKFIFDKPTKPNPNFDPNKPEGPNNPRMIEGTSIAGNIGRSLAANIVPIVGGIGAGLFTKNQPAQAGLPSDDTALNLAEYKKAANLLNQQQGLAADMNFLPAVAARKFTPEEMAVTYAQAANGGRIGRAEGGLMDLGGLEKDYRAEGGFVPIGKAEKADDVPARLSVNEFVFTADAVRNAGGGNVDEGAKVMERVMNHLEGGGQISRESQGLGGAQQMFETSERLSEVI
jgi:hypothetical protein